MSARKTTNRGRPAALLKAGAKLLATALVVGGIGTAFLVLNPGAEVDSTQADIVATEFAPRTPTARFADSLAALGHSEPLALELNGNQIFTSTAHHAEAPQQVLARYQAEFVDQGLNSNAYLNLNFDSKMQRDRAGFSGEMVPQKVTPGHIIMSGADESGGARDVAALIKAMRPGKSPAQTFSAYRWVEIYREPGASTSTVLASWSDEQFDYTKMVPKARAEARELVDARVPICPKCTLVNQLSDVGSPGTHLSYVFNTSHSREQLVAFYQAKLGQQGWQPEPSRGPWERMRDHFDTGLDEMEHLSLVRDGWTFDLTIFPVDRDTRAVRTVLVDPIYQRNLARNGTPE